MIEQRLKRSRRHLAARLGLPSTVSWPSFACSGAGGSAANRRGLCRKLEMEKGRPAACHRLFGFRVPSVVAIPALQRSHADTGGVVDLYPKVQADGKTSESPSLPGMGVARRWMVEYVRYMRGPRDQPTVDCPSMVAAHSDRMGVPDCFTCVPGGMREC